MSTALTAAARIAAIITSPEATGREDLALHLAKRTGFTVDQARARLRGGIVDAATVAALAKPPTDALFETGVPTRLATDAGASVLPSVAAPTRIPEPPAAVTASQHLDIDALWDATLRARGMVLHGDVTKPATMTPSTPNPAPLPTPDWGSMLRSRGMQVN
jgi:hypothetical protein